MGAILMRVLLAAAFLWFAAIYNAHATIALDATAPVANVATTSSSTIASPTYTATSSNDIIIAAVVCDHNVTPPTVTGATGGSLSWAQRATGIEGNTRLSVWYAVASGAFSSAVTVTFSAACGTPALLVFGVTGENTTTPWDSNGSLPAINMGVNSTTPTVTGVSTTHAKTMLLSIIGGPNNFTGTISGWNGIAEQFNTGGCCFAGFTAFDKIVSSTQSSDTVTYSATTNRWIMVADALVDAVQPATCSTRLPMTGVGC